MRPELLARKMQEEIVRRNSSIEETWSIAGKSAILNSGYKKESLHASKAYGPFIEDCNGNVYIDTALGAGTHILGHAHPVVVKEIENQAKQGSLFIIPNRYGYEVSTLLSRAIPHFHSFVFCNSGTEATMRAVRIARAYTGRKKVAMFSGGWHGGNDMLLFEDDYASSKNKPSAKFASSGIPGEVSGMILMLPYNSDAAFELIKQHKDELAMVMIEPSQGSNPRDDMKEFLHNLRKITAHHGILLCFDEIITGFRIALGGCQEYYNIKADIVTYGKTLGGGLPIGMVAGREEVMDVVKADKKTRPVFMGGTFSANPLVMKVSKVVLEYLLENRDTIYKYLNENGQHIRDTVNEFCAANQIPARMIGIGSMSRLIFTDRPIKSRRERDQYEIANDIQELFYLYLLLEKGIHVNKNRIIFLSIRHTKDEIGKVANSITETLVYFSKYIKMF